MGKQTRVPVVLLDGQIHAVRVGDAVVEQAFLNPSSTSWERLLPVLVRQPSLVWP